MEARKHTKNGQALFSPMASMAESIKEGVHQIEDTITDLDIPHKYEVAREEAQNAYKFATGFVKKNPVKSVLGASAVGYLLGMLMRSRK